MSTVNIGVVYMSSNVVQHVYGRDPRGRFCLLDRDNISAVYMSSNPVQHVYGGRTKLYMVEILEVGSVCTSRPYLYMYMYMYMYLVAQQSSYNLTMHPFFQLFLFSTKIKC